MSWWSKTHGKSPPDATGASAPDKALAGGARDPLLDPATLGRIGSYELIAKSVVDGVMSGKHRSTHRGGCSEFSDHRPYSQGDETRLIDWRLFARRDRHYVKLYDDETSLHAWLVMDASGSMGFGKSTISKFEYASRACACVGRLLLRQRDSLGLLTVVNGRRVRLAPRPQASHFQAVCEVLRDAAPTGGRALSDLLGELPGLAKRRGMVVVFSDCFGDVDSLVASLKSLRLRGHDVIVFQVLAPEEVRFDFRNSATFTDLEGRAAPLHVDASRVRKRYLERFAAFQEKLKAELTRADCELHTVTTDSDLGESIARFLSRRAAKKRGAARSGGASRNA